MKYLLVSLVALGVGTAAVASGTAESAASPPAKYPRCSKTVTDECMQAQPAAHHMAAKTMKHHRAHHLTQPAQKTS